jgi:hypothetical protein
MPLVFRIMRKDADGLPNISPKSLGVRRGMDVDVDALDNVLVNHKGMSVAPDWRDVNVLRIPKRLRSKIPGANGSNNTFCFRFGSGAFQSGPFASGLTLECDSATHGIVAPESIVPLSRYESDIAATRSDWREDET